MKRAVELAIEDSEAAGLAWLYAAVFGQAQADSKVALRVAAVSQAGFRSLPLYLSAVVSGQEANAGGDVELKAA